MIHTSGVLKLVNRLRKKSAASAALKARAEVLHGKWDAD